MRKNIFLCILSAIMLSQGFFSLWTIAGFYANRTFIAENLCVQKDIKENDCQGQCMLMDKLDKAHENEEKGVSHPVKEIHLFVQNFDLPHIEEALDVAELSSSVIFYYKTTHSKDFSDTVFRPPIA